LKQSKQKMFDRFGRIKGSCMPKKKSPTTVVPKEAVEVKLEPAATADKKIETRAARTRSHSVRSQKTTPEAAPAPVMAPVAAPVYEDLQQEIARLAYFFWEEGGRQHGSSVEDWLKAERTVLGKVQS
jgi:hypothetical protein